ncbi:MAG TPA: helix-turn-helix domain-containing protein [Actinospica sp.]|nr:helix-turn-helix domain-containing protein [Actinospica sp.]HWG26045.1 helix-turn-helix domain-containing protein [Actinospica sp.]
MVTLGMIGRSAVPGKLGFLGLLLAGGRDVPQLVGSVVGPVFDYDEQRSGALVETRDAYFESGSNATAAAKVLHVHPNTVSRRLDRISELLGPDWQYPQRMLEIQVALQLARMRGGLSDDPDSVPSESVGT